MIDLPTALATIFWLARDTFRQALASGVFWVMLTFNLVCIIVCLSIGVSGPEPPRGPDEPGKERLNPRNMTAEEKQQAIASGFDLTKSELRIGFGAIRVT